MTEQRDDDELVDEMIVARLAELTPAEVLTVVREMLGRTACRWCGSVPTVEESEGHWRTCEKHPARAALDEALAELAAAREREGQRLAAISTLCTSPAHLEGMHPDFDSAALQDVRRLVARYEAELAALRRVETENLQVSRRTGLPVSAQNRVWIVGDGSAWFGTGDSIATALARFDEEKSR